MKLSEGTLRLDMKNKVLHPKDEVFSVGHENRLPSEVVKAPACQI